MSDVPQYVKDLHEQRDEYRRKARAIDLILTELCGINGHDMVGDGHDSHYSYEKCRVCGRTEKC